MNWKKTLAANVPQQMPEPYLVETWCDAHRDIANKLRHAVDSANFLPESIDAHGDVRARNINLRVRFVASSFAELGRRALQRDDIDDAWEWFRVAIKLASVTSGRYAGTDEALIAAEVENEAYEELIFWAMHPDNGAVAVDAAAHQLQGLWQSALPWEVHAVNSWRMSRNAVAESFDDWTVGLPPVLGSPVRLVLSVEELRQQRQVDAFSVGLFYELRRLQPDRLGNASWPPVQSLSPTPIVRRGNHSEPASFSFADLRPRELARRAILYRLAAIAYHLRHGEYPDDFQGEDFEWLPDSPYDRGQRLSIWSDDEGSGPLATYVADLRQHDAGGSTSGVGRYRSFLLPEFHPWDPARHRARLNGTAQDYDHTIDEEISHGNGPAGGMGMEGYGGMTAGGAGGYGSRPMGYGGMGFVSPTEVPSTPLAPVAADAIAMLITQADEQTQVDSIPKLQQLPLEVALKLTYMAEPKVAAIASMQLAVAADEAFKESHSEYFAIHPNGDIGVPVTDRRSGHAYELVASRNDWHDARRMAEESRLGDRNGHLATITSPEEQRFVADYLAGILRQQEEDSQMWLGGRRLANGEWRWVCDPSVGEAFWHDGPLDSFEKFPNSGPDGGIYLTLEVTRPVPDAEGEARVIGIRNVVWGTVGTDADRPPSDADEENNLPSYSLVEYE